MLRALAALLAFVFIVLALSIPMFGLWGLHNMALMGVPVPGDHPAVAKTMYVLFLLAFGLFFALAAFACLRYMYRGREKAKLPPSHRISQPPNL